MSHPLISVIMPTYHCASKAARTIDSVLSQGGDFVEMIVVDGGSTDGTIDVLKGYGDRIRWISERDRGLYDAMNKGIALSTGRYLNFQGAGDTLRPDVLQFVASELPLEPLWFVYGKVFLEDGRQEHGEEFSKLILRNGNIPHQGIFYERSIFDRVGLYDQDYVVGADYVLCLQCFGDDGISKKYLDRVIANYEGGGISTTVDDVHLYRQLPGLIRRHLGLKAYVLYRVGKLVPKALREARVRLKHRRG